jgi:hypothetical protein
MRDIEPTARETIKQRPRLRPSKMLGVTFVLLKVGASKILRTLLDSLPFHGRPWANLAARINGGYRTSFDMGQFDCSFGQHHSRHWVGSSPNGTGNVDHDSLMNFAQDRSSSLTKINAKAAFEAFVSTQLSLCPFGRSAERRA